MDTTLGTIDSLGTIDPLGTRREILERLHHEIRTPLASLLGHVELLEDSNTDLPFRVEISVRAISRAGDRLRDLLAELDDVVAEPAAS